MRFSVLGPLEVTERGRRVAIGRDKERALLALLVLHANHVMSVDRLADELWDGSPPEQAGAALRVYVSRLRRALGDEHATLIETHASGYVLRIETDDLDVTHAERAADEGHRHLTEGRADTAAVRLRDALVLWRGPAYDEIADTAAGRTEASRLTELRLGVIEARVEADLACGRHAELVGELEALVAAHPLRERLWEARLLALYRSGRQSEALRAYQEIRGVLAEELGLAPGPGLVRLEQAILAHDPRLQYEPLSTTPTVPTTTPAVGRSHVVTNLPIPAALAPLGGDGPRFVGRGHELDHLRAAWEQAKAGRRQVVLLAGEPGIGKTSLAARLAADTHGQGGIVLFGHSDEAAVVPFQPFVEALGAYVDACDVDTLQRQVHVAPDLALLVPRLRDRVPSLPALAGAGAENERYRLFEAVAAFIAVVAEEAPIVLVLDDLHWADRPTLQLLHHTIKRCADAALLVVGTYRDTDLVRTHPLAETLVDLRRAELVDRLLLRGLTRDEIGEMLAPSGAEPSDLAFADALWTETEGSPLFVREILRHLSETGAAVRSEDGRWEAHRRLEQLGIPEGVKEVIGRRLSRLSDDANAVLACASVQGRYFRVDLVERLLDLGGDAVLDALDEAAAAGVVSEAAGTSGRYEFTHALVREALYDELSLTRRVRLHQRVGEAIEALDAHDLAPRFGELAHHFTQAAVAGNAAKAVEYGRQAGDEALRQVAYEQASAYYSAALEVAADAALGPDVSIDLLLARGQAEWRVGDARVARATLSAAADLARAAGDVDGFADAALGYAAAGIRPYWVEIGLVNEPSVALLEEALAACPPGDHPRKARVMACLAAQIYVVPETTSRREQLSADAVAMAERLGDPQVLAYTLATRNLAVWAPDNARHRLAIADHIIAMAPSATDPGRFSGLFHRFASLMEIGDVVTGRAALEDATDVATRLKDPVFLASTDIARAAILMCEGRLDEAEALARQAFVSAQEVRDPNAFALFGLVAGWIRRSRGHSHEILGMVTSLLGGRYSHMHAVRTSMLALLHVEIGDHDHARRLAIASDPDAIPRDYAWVFSMGALGLAVAELDEPALATRCLELLQPYSGRPVSASGVIQLTDVDLVLGALASSLGRHDEAVRHLEASILRQREIGWRAVEAEARMRLGIALRARDRDGDRQRAADESTRALAAAEEIGLAVIARRSRRTVAEASGRPVDDEPVAIPLRVRERAKARITTTGRHSLGRATRRRTDDELVRSFGTPRAQRALFAAMARAYQPAAAHGFEGTIQFELHMPVAAGDMLPPDWWVIEVRGRRARARRDRAEDPTVTIVAELPVFVRLAGGELDPVDALVDGLFLVRGDVLTASRLGDLFGIVADVEPPAEAASSSGRSPADT